MKVAVVGAGIAGIAAAEALDGRAEVTLFEGARGIGGHTDTHAILAAGRTYRVDSGFIVFNQQNYPHFNAWLDRLGVRSRPTDMSFGVCNRRSGLEYGSAGLGGLFCQRRNLASPRFLGMLRDLRRFYRQAGDVQPGDDRSLGRYLADEGYGAGFAEDHLLPMCAALWSLPARDARTVPVVHVVEFMRRHCMLQVSGRPRWRVIEGGSGSYLAAFADRFRGVIRTGEPVVAVARPPGRVLVTTHSGHSSFDALVLACHSDQALGLLEDPTEAERAVLGAIGYRRNRAVVHSDTSVMPRRRAAWSSWNAVVDGAADGQGEVTYWMNRLQGLDDGQPFFVTLNPRQPLERVWSERFYEHPQFTGAARQAQARRGEINGSRATWYCGAYWGWGFHEDGFVSGLDAAAGILREGSRAA